MEDPGSVRESKLTIAICTFNRAALLRDALQSFAKVRKPPQASFELLIVDNNSRDNTRMVVDEFAAVADFPVRYVFEKRQGLSRARNRAVAEARGRWIWYLDDDVYLSEDWLTRAVEGINEFSAASVIAGQVVPSFDDPKPAWLPDSLLPYYGLTSFGDSSRWLKETEFPVGANVAFRKSIFDEVGFFKPSLGRIANLLLSCEETEVVSRLYNRGHKVGYAAGAKVRHRVVPHRAKISWLRRRAYWGGISYVLTEGTPGSSHGFGLIREAAQTVRGVVRELYREGLGVENQIRCAWQLGTARQFLVEATRNSGIRRNTEINS